jgi:hypothetical protein
VLLERLTGAVAMVLAAPGDPTPGVPNPPPAPIPGLAPVADMFLGWGKWTLIVAGVMGFFVCAGMMIMGRRNRSSTAVDGATGIPWVLAGLTVTAIGAAVVGVVLK